MVCLFVWRDNPWALASALSTIQVDKPYSYLTCMTPSIYLAYNRVSRAKDFEIQELYYSLL